MTVDPRREAVERILRRNGVSLYKAYQLGLEIVETLPAEGYDLVPCNDFSQELEEPRFDPTDIIVAVPGLMGRRDPIGPPLGVVLAAIAFAVILGLLIGRAA